MRPGRSDGNQLATSSERGTEIWDATTGQPIARIAGAPTRWAGWNPDGKTMATGGSRVPVRILEVATGRLVRELHAMESASGAWSPDGAKLAYADEKWQPKVDDPRASTRVWEGVRVFDTTNWQEHLTLSIRQPSANSSAKQVGWSPDSARIAVLSAAGGVLMFDAAAGELLFVLPWEQTQAQSFAWHRDGKIIALGRQDGTIRVVDSRTGQEISTVGAHASAVQVLAWSPDGRRLASAAWNPYGEAKVWDTATWQAVLVWRRLPEQGPTFLAWRPDGMQLASVGPFQPVKVWDTAPRNPVWGDIAAQDNDWAWVLATCPEIRWRDPIQAIRLARKAVEAKPQDGNFHNTLGAAHYRAGEWTAAVAALKQSMHLRKGGDAFDWYFMAMAHRQLGEKKEARHWYDKAVGWNDKNIPGDEELRRFRAEAAELLAAKQDSHRPGSAPGARSARRSDRHVDPRPIPVPDPFVSQEPYFSEDRSDATPGAALGATGGPGRTCVSKTPRARRWPRTTTSTRRART